MERVAHSLRNYTIYASSGTMLETPGRHTRRKIHVW